MSANRISGKEVQFCYNTTQLFINIESIKA